MNNYWTTLQLIKARESELSQAARSSRRGNRLRGWL
jgi:hypothetical protein